MNNHNLLNFRYLPTNSLAQLPYHNVYPLNHDILNARKKSLNYQCKLIEYEKILAKMLKKRKKLKRKQEAEYLLQKKQATEQQERENMQRKKIQNNKNSNPSLYLTPYLKFKPYI